MYEGEFFLKVVKVFKEDVTARSMLTDLLQKTLGKARAGNTECMQDRYQRDGEWHLTRWGEFEQRLAEYDTGVGNLFRVKRSLVYLRRAAELAQKMQPASQEAIELREGFFVAHKVYTIVACKQPIVTGHYDQSNP